MWNDRFGGVRLRAGRALVLGALTTAFVGCGSDDTEKPAGGLSSTSGSGGGGTGGQGINVGSGGKAGSGGSGGSTIMLHTCPATPESCPEKVFTGDFDPALGNTLSELDGVTEVTGNLTISGDYVLDSLECLQLVQGNVAISSANDDKSMYGLRSLKEVGGKVSLGSVFDRMYLDCALSNLTTVGVNLGGDGNIEIDGVRGDDLDLSKLTDFDGIHLTGTHFERLVLPSTGTFGTISLSIAEDDTITTIAGFDGVTLGAPASQFGNALELVDNPLLSTCRANELRDQFVAAGYPTTAIEISGNASDCP